ncbi:DUF6338 family protein [Streptomyces sp. MUM 178J]|uniref:DUF6338 family protein n=1 Tax=Streptomyces sp. MUM 178J TaxID=2791991 RepID=UPI003FA73478
MPATFIGLLIFMVLLSPGLTYTWTKERSLPSVKLSPFRETATVAFASAASLTVTLLLFTIAHAALPSDWTPNLGELVRRPGDYVRNNYAFIAWWSLGILLGAMALALTFGKSVRLRNLSNRLIFSTPSHPEKFKTEWEVAFTRPTEKCTIRVTLLLDGGWVFSGDLSSRSTSTTEETQDRELTLDSPIYCQAPRSNKQKELNVDSVIISARRIAAMAIEYVK